MFFKDAKHYYSHIQLMKPENSEWWVTTVNSCGYAKDTLSILRISPERSRSALGRCAAAVIANARVSRNNHVWTPLMIIVAGSIRICKNALTNWALSLRHSVAYPRVLLTVNPSRNGWYYQACSAVRPHVPACGHDRDRSSDRCWKAWHRGSSCCILKTSKQMASAGHKDGQR